MIGICVGSNFYHKDSLEKIGLAPKNFWPTAKITFPMGILFLIPLIIYSWGQEVRGDWNLWFSLMGYPFWGFAQEYALMSFSANRLADVFPGKWGTISIFNGSLFSIAHLPNPILTFVTLISGILFTYIFLKRKHILPLALVHAIFGIALSLALSHIPGIMSVGPAYLSRIGRPF